MSDYAYEVSEAQEFRREMAEAEQGSIEERKESAHEYFLAMRDSPSLVGERVGWLIDGNYGYGAMQAAKRIISSPRMNRSASLSQIVAALEWKCPQKMAASAWNKLTSVQKTNLEWEVSKAAGFTAKKSSKHRYVAH